MKTARFVSRLQRSIQNALQLSGMTQQQVAEKLGVDRSVINRRLKGKANLTARSIAEFAYALDKDIIIELVDQHKPKIGSNWISKTTIDQLPSKEKNPPQTKGGFLSDREFCKPKLESALS